MNEAPLLICYDDSTGARHAVESAATLFPGRRAVVLDVAPAVTAQESLADLAPVIPNFEEINTAASVLSSLIPVPGGIGAAEASLSAGLIALGVDQSTAFAIAITQRLCTFYLPPIWGYVSLRWLTHKGYV